MTTEAKAAKTGAESAAEAPRDPNVAALRRVPIFAGLEDDTLARLAQNCRRRHTEASEESLFLEGDDPGSLYVIVKGTVHIRTLTTTGKPVHIAERGPGDHIGELALLDGAPRMADAVTASPCDLLILSRDAFVRCVDTSPQIAHSIMRSLAARLREAARHQASQEEQDVTGRIARLLLDKIDHAAATGGDFPLKARQTHQQMADQIGAARESVSRALADLRRLNILRMEGHRIIVIDLKKLQRQAERSR